MNQKIVTIAPGETLVVEWEQNWSNLSIRQNGALIGTVQNKAELKGGRTFDLSDGRKVTVVVSDYGLEIWHNGVELVSGTKSGFVDGFGNAFKALISVGTLQLILSAIFLFMGSTVGMVMALVGALIGGALIGLGLWARNSGSKSPFWIGIAFCLFNIVISIGSGTLSGIVVTGILLYYLYRGTQSVPPQPTRKVGTMNTNDPLDSDL